MSAETYQRPRTASHAEQMSHAEQEYRRQVDELRAEAEKRFWKLVSVENGLRFEVQDQLGRILYGPAHFPSLRGFFANQLPQA